MTMQQPLPTIDLRAVTRYSGLCNTTVTLHWDWNTKFPWIVAGQCQLRTDLNPNQISLDARMEGCTDREHDTAYAFKLPIIGHRFEHVYGHTVTLTAWVNPNEAGNFHVPSSTKPAGYDLKKHPESYLCKECTGKEAHMIVPYFVPPVNTKLFRQVCGKMVTITIGPVYPPEA